MRQLKPWLQWLGWWEGGQLERPAEAHLQNGLPFFITESLHGRFLKILLDVIVILFLCFLHVLIAFAYVLGYDAVILGGFQGKKLISVLRAVFYA